MFHPTDLIIILALIILLAGGKRLSGLGAALGKSVMGYRRAVRGEDGPPAAVAEEQADNRPPVLLPEGQSRGQA